MIKKIPNNFLQFASNILADTDFGLTGTKITKYFLTKSIEFNVEVPYTSIPFPKDIPNKRTAFLKNIEKFSNDQQYSILKEVSEELKGGDKVDDLRTKLITRYGDINENPVNVKLIEETKHWLQKYNSSYKLYTEAYEMYKNSQYERNLVDNLRLSLELLLKDILNNNKSLENQLSKLGDYQKERGNTKELTNMLNKLIDYYSKYNNRNIKHNDNVNSKEVGLIFDLTSSFMKYLINE